MILKYNHKFDYPTLHRMPGEEIITPMYGFELEVESSKIPGPVPMRPPVRPQAGPGELIEVSTVDVNLESRWLRYNQASPLAEAGSDEAPDVDEEPEVDDRQEAEPPASQLWGDSTLDPSRREVDRQRARREGLASIVSGLRPRPMTPIMLDDYRSSEWTDHLEGLAAQVAAGVPDFDKYFYFKWDGTIKGGFEAVSQPMTERFIREVGHKPINLLLARLVQAGFRSHNAERSSCGFHVHVTKDSVGNIQTYKMMNLIYSNPTRIVKLSQRRRSFLDQYANLRMDAQAQSQYAKAKGFLGKYSAVNLLPEDTVEFRFLRGNLKPQRFWKNMEFIMALYAWTKECSVPESKKWFEFCGWVKERPREYGRLGEFLEQVNKTPGEIESFSVTEGKIGGED